MRVVFSFVLMISLIQSYRRIRARELIPDKNGIDPDQPAIPAYCHTSHIDIEMRTTSAITDLMVSFIFCVFTLRRIA